MFQKVSVALWAVAAALSSVPAHGSNVFPGGGTLAQIMDGGGTNTIFTIANLDAVAIPYQLFFYDDNGNPMTLSTTAGPPSTSLSGTLAAGASLIIQTNGGGSTVLAGYAILSTNPFTVDPMTGSLTSLGNQIAGSAVFGLPLSTGTFAQASSPLDSGIDSIIEIPFDGSGDAFSAQTGVALVNSFADAPFQFIAGGSTATIAATFFDSNGNSVSLPSISLRFGQHMSFLLDQRFPQLKGQKGVIRFSGTDPVGAPYFFKVLGVRATATTYTSITPIIPCNAKFDSNTQSLSCTN